MKQDVRALGVAGLVLAAAGLAQAGTVIRRWSAQWQTAPGHPTAPPLAVRFDLSDLPKDATVHWAELRAARTSAPMGMDDDALVDVRIVPRTGGAAGAEPAPGAKALKLVAPWFDRFDATDAVRGRPSGATSAAFLIKTFPRLDPKAVFLDVAFEGEPKQVPPQVAGLAVRHRRGQTFITWREIDDPVGRDEIRWGPLKEILEGLDRKRRVRYLVYRSQKPITAATLHLARRVATVRPLSCWNVNGRNIERAIDEVIATREHMLVGHGNPFGRAQPDGKFGVDCPVDRLVVRDGAEPLPRATGLYVHTCAKPGAAFYAVLTSVNGVVNTASLSAANSLEAPVAEAAGEGEPVLQGELPHPPMWRYPDRRLHYVRWVAPPYGNLPCQYYNWSVAVPAKLGEQVPLELCFHRDAGSYWRTHYRIERDSIVLAPHDFPLQTWWYGYHESIGTLRSFRRGAVHNYTQRRLLAFIEWAARKWPIDRNRVLVTGTAYSGGSGALHLGLRHPEVFSLICSGHGVPDYAAAIRGTAGGRRRRMFDSLQRVCGKLDWALRAGTGRSVWEELDLTEYVRGLPAGAELPMVAMSAQHYVAWGLWPAYHEFFNVMLAKRRSLVASFSWYGARIVAVSRTATFPGVIRLDVARNRSMLAFRGPGTAVLSKPKGGMGGFNGSFRWKDVLDRPGRYEVTVFAARRSSRPTKVPVTLRRLQRFPVTAGKSYHWTNRSLDGKTLLQEGDVAAGADKLLTIEAFEVHTDGSRLAVEVK
jgi:hypothetical protein